MKGSVLTVLIWLELHEDCISRWNWITLWALILSSDSRFVIRTITYLIQIHQRISVRFIISGFWSSCFYGPNTVWQVTTHEVTRSCTSVIKLAPDGPRVASIFRVVELRHSLRLLKSATRTQRARKQYRFLIVGGPARRRRTEGKKVCLPSRIFAIILLAVFLQSTIYLCRRQWEILGNSKTFSVKLSFFGANVEGRARRAAFEQPFTSL